MHINHSRIDLFKLRAGVFLIFIWWIPLYVLIPAAAAANGSGSTAVSQTQITVIIILVQSILGVIGFFLIGKSLAGVLKKVKFKYMPKVFWRMFWSGNTEVNKNELKTPKKTSRHT